MTKRLTASEIADQLEAKAKSYEGWAWYSGIDHANSAQQIRENLADDSGDVKRSHGIELIAAERERQITGEGFGSSRDDNYINEELALAASFYAMPFHKRNLEIMNWLWPWHFTGWKPSPDNRIRELAKAGALIAAEIDRLKRSESNVP